MCTGSSWRRRSRPSSGRRASSVHCSARAASNRMCSCRRRAGRAEGQRQNSKTAEGDMYVVRTGFIVAVLLSAVGAPEAYAQPFHLLEATIPEVHRAIQEGQVTCRGLVEAYLNRAKAYNGTCNSLVT